MDETETQATIFEFSGNRLCLDFCNTVNNRTGTPIELLHSYRDLVAWSQAAQILTDDEARQLLEEAANRPAEASAALEEAINVREAIFRIFFIIAEGSAPAEADLITLNTALSKAMTRACIVPKAGGFTWDWTGSKGNLDRMLAQVVRSAVDLLTSEELSTVHICASEDCGWLFLDTSKNHSRRWCDMKSCGNRAKARRHYGRKKTSPLEA